MLSKGDKILLEEKDGIIFFKPALSLIEEFAGSLKVPKRFTGLNEDVIIKKSKKEYFSNKKA